MEQQLDIILQHYALLFWYVGERNWSIQSTSTIVKPRRESADYGAGDYIVAKFRGKPYRAVIVQIKEDKEQLLEGKVKFGALLKDKNLSPQQLLEEMGVICTTLDFEDPYRTVVADRVQPTVADKCQPPVADKCQPPVADKRQPPVADKCQPPATKKRKNISEVEDEAKQAKAEANKRKRETAKERQVVLDSVSRSLLDTSQSSSTVNEEILETVKNTAAAVRRMETKVETLINAVDSVVGRLHCKLCVNNVYKKIYQAQQSGNTIKDFFSPRPHETARRSLQLNSPDTHGQGMNTVAIPCTSEGTSSSDDSHMERHVPVVIDDIAVANEESESNMGSDVELTFLGHARHGVKLRRVDISRSQKAAKTAIKFALNIIEFLLTKEQITTTSVYGNKQHKLFPMDVQKLEALHSHIDNVYTKGMEAKEREAAWEAVTDALNNKLRKLRQPTTSL